MTFENQPLGFDEETQQWKVQVCCHTCGKVGEMFCFKEEWDYDEHKNEDFPCGKCFWENEIKALRNGTSDHDMLIEGELDDVLKEEGISWAEWGEFDEKKTDEIHDKVNKRFQEMSDEKIKSILTEYFQEGDCEFNGEVCKA